MMAKVTLKTLLRRHDDSEIDRVLREACKISKGEVQVVSQKVLPPASSTMAKSKFSARCIFPQDILNSFGKGDKEERENTLALTVTELLKEHENYSLAAARI